MRNIARSSVLAVALAVGALVMCDDPASAGTKRLSGTYTDSQVGLDCWKAGGTFTSGTGPHGYGCKTSSGSVSCTAAGKCTGTCSACSAMVGTADPTGGRKIWEWYCATMTAPALAFSQARRIPNPKMPKGLQQH